MIIQLPLGIKEKEQFPHNHLQTLLDGFVDFRGVENCEHTFKGLSLNSKKVHEQYLFLACAGTSAQHGIAYAGEAINRGANCIAWEPTAELETMPQSCAVKDKKDVPLIRVEALHKKAGEIAARFYRYPSRSLDVIGITGTNGKTSTTHFIAQLIHALDAEQIKEEKNTRLCAVIGTLGNGIYGALEEGTHTTPDAVTLQAMIAEFNNKADTLVMEVSSHALSQGRVNGVEFDTAVFTNLTRDHLDYHGDMKSYADEKLKLFQLAKLKHIIVNHDDDFTSEIIAATDALKKGLSEEDGVDQAEIIRYSRNDKSVDFFAEDVSLNQEGLSFTLCVSNSGKEKNRYRVNSQLVGDFNIDNLLAAIAVLSQRDYELDNIVSVIPKMTTVPGRMEMIRPFDETAIRQPLIVVDYAHTPDALEKSLTALRAHTQGKLFCLFGCGGDRDKGKRPLMARVAEAQADNIMVSSDNPRTELPEQIIAEIVSGFKHMNKVATEVDREQAIKKILHSASSDDVVLIAGKGHEKYQEINGKKFPFSDKACVLTILANRKDH